jgi:hypothetical protein
MSLTQELKELAKKRNIKECTFLGKKILARVYSKNGWKKVWAELIDSITASDGTAEEILAKQFLDPQTKKPVFTKSMLENDLTQPDVEELVTLFMRMNKADPEAVERAEKN